MQRIQHVDHAVGDLLRAELKLRRIVDLVVRDERRLQNDLRDERRRRLQLVGTGELQRDADGFHVADRLTDLLKIAGYRRNHAGALREELLNDWPETERDSSALGENLSELLQK